MTDTLLEIKHELRTHGSCFENGKLRIAALYERETDEREIAKALAKEWGVGGHSHTYLDGTTGFVDYDSKGFRFCGDHFKELMTVPWNKVARIIRKMIDDGDFLSYQEQARYAEWKAAQPAASVSTAAVPGDDVPDDEEPDESEDIGSVENILTSGQITFDDLLGGGI